MGAFEKCYICTREVHSSAVVRMWLDDAHIKKVVVCPFCWMKMSAKKRRKMRVFE